jgi:hypothetical protein
MYKYLSCCISLFLLHLVWKAAGDHVWLPYNMSWHTPYFGIAIKNYFKAITDTHHNFLFSYVFLIPVLSASSMSPVIQQITECIYTSNTSEMNISSSQVMHKVKGTAYQLILNYRCPCRFTSNIPTIRHSGFCAFLVGITRRKQELYVLCLSIQAHVSYLTQINWLW